MNSAIAFIISTLAGFSTLAGAFIVFITKNKVDSFLVKGISFAAGVMFSLSIIDLIPEGFKFLNLNIKVFPSVLFILISITSGLIIAIFIDKLFPSNSNNLYKLGLITMLGLMIHNIPEGIATFMTTNEDLKLGISLAISISMHNIPEGISIALPIYYSSKSKKKSFIYVLVCAISEPIGALLAYLFLKPTYLTLGLTYGVIAGIMIYISMYELLPSAFKYKKSKIVIIFYSLGLILVLINKFIF